MYTQVKGFVRQHKTQWFLCVFIVLAKGIHAYFVKQLN